MITNQIKLGTHIIIKNDKGEILLCKRNKEFGNGEWELPGGHLEFQETFEQNLEKECREELGIKVELGRLVSVSPNMKYGNHYIIFTFLAKSFEGEPKNIAIKEHSEIDWFAENNLPDNLFVATKNSFEDYFSKEIYRPHLDQKQG